MPDECQCHLAGDISSSQSDPCPSEVAYWEPEEYQFEIKSHDGEIILRGRIAAKDKWMLVRLSRHMASGQAYWFAFKETEERIE